MSKEGNTLKTQISELEKKLENEKNKKSSEYASDKPSKSVNSIIKDKSPLKELPIDKKGLLHYKINEFA